MKNERCSHCTDKNFFCLAKLLIERSAKANHESKKATNVKDLLDKVGMVFERHRKIRLLAETLRCPNDTTS